MADPNEAPPGIWATIVAVFRRNRVPCLFVNLIVVLLVSSYYMVPSVAAAWAEVGAFKVRSGYVFSAISGAASAAFLPYVAQRLMGTWPKENGARRLLILTLFWAYRAVEVDLFYHLQAWMFGTGSDFQTRVCKVFVDQFIYSVFWAAPNCVLILRWLDLGCSWRKTWASLDRQFWTRTFPAVILTNWLVWIPVVSLVYGLPSPLQFPLFTVVMSFFVLVVTLLAVDEKETARPQSTMV